MTLDQRKIMALTLTGKGVEVCAGPRATSLPDGVVAKHASPLTTEQHRAVYGDIAPPVDVRIRDLSSAWTGAPAHKRLNFVILNSEAMTRSPNPLGLISSWGDQLAQRGAIMIAIPSRSRRSAGGRPVTPVEHLFSDFKRRRSTACDEHRLASAFEDNPKQFPDPTGVGLVLAYLWALRLFDLDAHARRLIGSENEEYLERLFTDPGQPVRHHVFSVRSLLAALDVVNAESNFLLAPYDVSLGRLPDEEDIVLFRRFEKAALKNREGKASWAECTSMFRRQAATLRENDVFRAEA